MLACEAATDWNRGIPHKILNFLIKLYFFVSWFIVLLNISKRLSEVRYFEMKWIYRPISQIQPETGESIVFFFKTLIQLYLLRSFFYSLTYCIKEVIKSKIFWRLNGKSVGLWGSYGLKQGNPLKIFKDLTSDNIFDPLSRTKYNFIRNVNILQGIPLFQAVAAS